MNHFSPRLRRDERLRTVLHRALEHHGLRRHLERHISPAIWADAVGAQLASRAQPTVLAHGVLHLLVQDYMWRDQIDAARSFVIERLNRRLGAPLVRELRFGLAHAGALDQARSAVEPRNHGSPVEPSRVLGEARLDGTLREALLRAAEAASRRAARA